MKNENLTRSDAEIQKDVREELNWKPRTDGSEINVDVLKGIVRLSGEIDSFAKKMSVQKAAVRIPGVKGIINDLEIKIPAGMLKSDSEIERAVLDAIKWNSTINGEKIMVLVKDARVSLEGEVQWEFQKSRATALARDINGLVALNNNLKIISARRDPKEVQERINATLKRNYYLNHSDINVKVSGSKAILSGKVKTPVEKAAAESAAWSLPGIMRVENKLEVNYPGVYV